MKRIISMILAALIVVAGLSFPVFAIDSTEFTTITPDMIKAEGATIEYDSYLSSYKITANEAGSTVTVKIANATGGYAFWLPATAADETLSVRVEDDRYLAETDLTAGHKFKDISPCYETEEIIFSYTPSAVYSLYIFDKMNDGIEDIEKYANGSIHKYGEEYLDLDTYEVDRYTKYYWDGDIVFNESFFVLQEKDGTIAPKQMMYDIDRVVSVKNSFLNKEYVYGEDYLIEDGKLVIPEGSAIRSYTYSTVYKDSDTLGNLWETLRGDYVMAGQYDMYFTGYMNITYTAKSEWEGAIPEAKGIYLQNVIEKLNNDGGTVKVMGIGDSIAGGANVSGDIGDTGVAPYADPWCDMTAKAIQERYPNVTIENETIALGGATATYAIERMADIVAYDPDLLIIEFGTNECMAGETADYYIDTLTQAIEAVNANVPDCDIIIAAPILSNPLIFPEDWFFAYADALYSLERQGVAISDSTSIHQYLDTRKNYLDMTGDFLCHPNDFSNRIFVQSIMKTLENGSEADYIAGLADRILNYRYEVDFDSADWENLTSLAAAASADIAASATADEARAKYMEHIEALDAIPTSAENIANSSIDISKLIFSTVKPLDTVSATNNVNATFNEDEKALSAYITNSRKPSLTIDYTAGDNTASADGFDYVVFTLKAPLTNGTRAKQTKLTYKTEAGSCATVTLDLILDGKYHSYIVDMSADANWTGKITSLEIQPFASSSTKDTLLVSSIILAGDGERAKDLAIERERAANKDAAEAVTYLMSDEATSALLQTAGGESYLAGDADGNNKVTALDSLIMRRALVGVDTDGANVAALDMNEDGSVNLLDSALIKMILCGRAEEYEIGGGDAKVSYSEKEKAAEIALKKDNVTLTVDMQNAGLSGDMFKYITVCAKNANGEAVKVTVTYTYADGTSEKTVDILSDALFNAETAKFFDASGEIVSIAFTIHANAGETVYFDSFVLTPTLPAAENAEAVRVGAANLF